MEFKAKRKDLVPVWIEKDETEAVRIAVENLKVDLQKVLETETLLSKVSDAKIVVGTIGVSHEIERYFDLHKLQDETGEFRKEAYILTVTDGRLVIAGTDRRGTIYGIYEFCEWMGVSPWYFWADVPVRKRECIHLPEGYEKIDYPSVEYRGIFINDEEELEHWAKLHMDENTIGTHTYEKIFELLLRLKGNYIWPAMHVNSFNIKKENGALADRMGIVVGTSHCDMLMRSNNREWLPWLSRKGYQDAKYDYSIEGRNREILNEYWRESVQQNKDFEVSYTLGMRGIHDSGFETSMLDGKTDEELRRRKIELLETIISNQDQILEEELTETPLRLFIPYKEVLELYDHGLKIPEDFTMIWANDNYGYIRRYPSIEEQKRPGGHGIYYHNSYWSPPGRSYLFLCSIPLAHTKYELMKAYQEGIQKLWILNVGALKPLEMEVEFFLRLAWEAGRTDERTADTDRYVSQWIDRNFSGDHGQKLAPMINQFSQIANVRKLEMMEDDVFSQTAYGDEAVVRVHKLKEILDKADEVYDSLPADEKDAFFQLVLMRIHAVYLTMCQYYFSDRSTLCCSQGKMQAAKQYVEETRAYEDARRKLIFYYNHNMSGGKWNGIVTPEDFPPPRTAMYPACTPPLSMGETRMLISLWNEEDKISFVSPSTKWLEISNAGAGSFQYKIEAPDWVKLSKKHGQVSREERILISADDTTEKRQGKILITNESDGSNYDIPVEIDPVPADFENPEDDGAVVISMSGVKTKGFRTIPRLGREEGSLLEGYKEGAETSFPIYLTSEGEFLLEVHRFPSLNSTGRIRMGVKIDDGEFRTIESKATDEYRDTWECNSANNVDKLWLKLAHLNHGSHTITLKVIDRYFAVSKLVIYTKKKKENNLGILRGSQELPKTGWILKWADDFYGNFRLKPRKEIFARKSVTKDSLVATDHFIEVPRYAKTKTPEKILKASYEVFEEKDQAVKIDAVTAYMQTDFAFTEQENWQYCSSESYGRSGLALYIRDKERYWKDVMSAPKLNYQIKCTGGRYCLWVLLRINPTRLYCLGAAVDHNFLSENQLYNQGRLWRYEAEQIWQWLSFADIELSKGKHLLTLAVLSGGVRIDRLYLTKKSDTPPMDLYWDYGLN